VQVAGLVALIASVAALDSLNPSTVGPALVLAVGGHPRRAVAAFTAGVFAVSTLGGLGLLFGPGRGLLTNVAKPSPHTLHLVEAASGAALIAGAVALWLVRHRVGRRLSSPHGRGGRSAFVLGAGIMTVELPTAFPYFAVIAAIVGSHAHVVTQIALVVLFNAVFVAPLAAILAIVVLSGERGAQKLEQAHVLLHRHGRVLAPVLIFVVAIVLILLGSHGLAGD